MADPEKETASTAEATNSDGGADSEGGTDKTDTDETEGDEAPEPAVQSEAFRRQQLFVGSGIAALAGIAVTVSTLQQLPDVPFLAALVGGMLTSALLFGLVYVGIFRAAD